MGQRTGRPRGRPSGAKNKASAKREAEIAASGLTPLDYMLKVMRDRKKPADMRLDAAAKAASFVHPKLASIIHKGDTQQTIVVVQVDGQQYASIAKRLLKEV